MHSEDKSLVLQRLSMESPTNSSSEPSPQAKSPPQDVAEQSQLRQSTGSIAIRTRQQEALDHRRHTFSALSAESRATMRRRSYDFTTPIVGGTFPPCSPLPHSLKTHHLQHLRVYGKSGGGCAKSKIGECHEQGAPIVDFVSPRAETVWTRGKRVEIKWKVMDPHVDKVRIELLQDGLSATTLIATDAPNTGFFSYHRVPWGMESGSKYFLRVSAVDADERFCTSSFFQISSAP